MTDTHPLIGRVHLDPHRDNWGEHLVDVWTDDQILFDRPLQAWRRCTRDELGLATDRPVVATGHQTLLWHPGILAKYLALDAFAGATNVGVANLVVDQHVNRFGSFDLPVQRTDGSWQVRTLHLAAPRPDVPMSLHDPVAPPRPHHLPEQLALDDELDHALRTGLDAILDRVAAHVDASNLARQMAAALSDLMQPWVDPLTHVSATQLTETRFSRRVLEALVSDPQTAIARYNEAVASVPEAGIGPLLVRDDYVEVPLWRIRPDGRRMRAYDADVERWLEGDDLTLMPRALYMTAMLRLTMCDLFIHGTGGGLYDRAMERWMADWLGVRPAPAATVTADVHLPLLDPSDRDRPPDLAGARARYRHTWHDPLPHDARLSAAKAAWLARIDALPRGSAERRRAFRAMHLDLARWRADRSDAVQEAADALVDAKRLAASQSLARRRDWAFPLYPQSMLDDLAARVRAAVHPAAAASSG